MQFIMHVTQTKLPLCDLNLKDVSNNLNDYQKKKKQLKWSRNLSINLT